jgi:hypothetical protein
MLDIWAPSKSIAILELLSRYFLVWAHHHLIRPELRKWMIASRDEEIMISLMPESRLLLMRFEVISKRRL